MSEIAATQIPKPRDEQAFERACLILFRCVLGDPNVQTNARRGQAQDGVDIFGFRSQDPTKPVGTQCKLKGPDKPLSEKELRTEVGKALNFQPALREYFVVTTAPDDGELQRIARELTVEQAVANRAITINVWGWDTLQQRISEYPEALNAFDPTYGPHAKEQLALLARMTDQQEDVRSLVVSTSASVAEIRSKLISVEGVGDITTAASAIDAALDAEVDAYRDAINRDQPRTALMMLEALLRRVETSASQRILFRIKANIGHCYLALGDDARAAHWLGEAYQHAPAEPKAVSNFVIALLLQKKNTEAFEFARQELAKDATNAPVAGYLLQAAGRCPDQLDPFEQIPVTLRGMADVDAGFVDFLRSREKTPDWWVKARSGHAAHPDNKFLAQSAAEADIDEVGRSEEFKQNARLSSATRERLEHAAAVLHAIWDRRRASENPRRSDGLAACCNLLGAYYALGERQQALLVAKQAIEVAPDDEMVLQRAMIAALDAGDDPFAKQVLEKLPISSEASLMRFQFYAHTGDWAKLTSYEKWSVGIPENERVAMETLAQLATLMLGANKNDPREELKRILKAADADARGSVLVSDFAERLKQPDIAELAYRQAVSLVEQDSHRVNRSMVVRTAGRREDWSTVTRLLDGHIELNKPSDDLNLLMTALANEKPVRRRALEFFDELPETIRTSALGATAFGYLQSRRGDLSEAEKWLQTAIKADPTYLTAWLGLLGLYVRRGGADAAAQIQEQLKYLDLATARGAPREKMLITHFIRDAGFSDRAVKFAYETVRAHPNDPEVALLYFGLLLGDHAGHMVPTVTTVGVNTWVALESNSKQRLELLIEEGPDKPAENLYSPMHPFIAPALGLSAGESFTQSKPFGAPEVWRVLEVKHKYLHLFHEMHKFNVRFPEAKGFYSLSLQGEDITPVLEQVKRVGEHARRIADLYIDKHLPLAVVAGIDGRNSIGLAEYVRRLRHDIVACLGNLPERTAAEQLAMGPPPGGAVLDLYTAWIAAALNLLGPLKAVFGRLVVPRAVIDAIRQLEDDVSDERGGQSMSMAYDEGSYVRHVQEEEDLRALRRMLEERRAAIEAHCDVLPVDVPSEISPLATALVDKSDPHVLDAAFLAAAEDRVLLSDDLYFRQFAAQSCGATRGVWLQAALNVARHKKILNSSSYAEAIIGLAICRHSHIALEEHVLREVLRLDDTEELHKFSAVAEFIGTKSAEVVSHLNVATNFLVMVWSENVSDLRKAAASGLILEKLLRLPQPDLGTTIAIVRSRLRKSSRASQYFEEWCRGHFLTV